MERAAAPAPHDGRGLGGRAESTDGLAFAGVRAQPALVASRDSASCRGSTGGVREWVKLHVTDHAQLDPRSRGTMRLGGLRPLLRLAHTIEGVLQLGVGRMLSLTAQLEQIERWDRLRPQPATRPRRQPDRRGRTAHQVLTMNSCLELPKTPRPSL